MTTQEFMNSGAVKMQQMLPCKALIKNIRNDNIKEISIFEIHLVRSNSGNHLIRYFHISDGELLSPEQFRNRVVALYNFKGRLEPGPDEQRECEEITAQAVAKKNAIDAAYAETLQAIAREKAIVDREAKALTQAVHAKYSVSLDDRMVEYTPDTLPETDGPMEAFQFPTLASPRIVVHGVNRTKTRINAERIHNGDFLTLTKVYVAGPT